MNRSGGFRADVEGLRAVAVLAVVIYDAGLGQAGGGYVGVDTFYVLSGFLITGLLWQSSYVHPAVPDTLMDRRRVPSQTRRRSRTQITP